MATYYVAPGISSGSGAGTYEDPWQFNYALDQIANGDTITFKNGTYTATEDVIDFLSNSRNGYSGASDNYITFNCETEGSVLLSGSGGAQPCKLNGNRYLNIEGFNFTIGPGSDYTVKCNDWSASGDECKFVNFRRCIVYDNTLAGQLGVVGAGITTGPVLFEDCAFFGVGRKTIEVSQSLDTLLAEKTVGTISNPHITFRRCYAQWTGSTHSEPKNCLEFNYLDKNNLYENCIFRWHRESGTVTNTEACCEGGQRDWARYQTGHRMYGCIVISADNDQYDAGALLACHGGFGDVIIENCVFYSGDTNAVQPVSLAAYGAAGANQIFRNNTMRSNSNASSINASWTTSNLDDGSTSGTINNIFNNATGAQVLKRYVDGTLTGDDLWPWPMDARIKAAFTTAGYDAVTAGQSTDDGNVTTLITNHFGEIPGQGFVRGDTCVLLGVG